MPQAGGHDIYSQVPLRHLLNQQMRALMPDLQRCSGPHALWLTAAVAAPAPVLPLLGHWVQLSAGQRYGGDLLAAIDEPLPFTDDAFDLVLLRHALEVLPTAAELLHEAVRVLAPDGVLVVTGIHPGSVWAPWFYWRSRGLQRQLWAPWRLCRLLRQGGLAVERVQRVGRLWPSERESAHDHSVLGGGYVLIARKRRVSLIPLRVNAQMRRAPVAAQWLPGAQRSSVCWSPFLDA
ncbi:MAG: methyltransferase domain-containing protein [Rhodanobacter sp.]